MADVATEESISKRFPPSDVAVEGDFDLSLLQDSLKKTVWERMQANDDALNFMISLQEAMEKRNAKLK